ncbi:MAG: leucine-rich repeat domain-containing protein [Myxococcaceae bacterium]|nr:leucine-rich repeat domain-containing protein [Myxococcaceae bacterium]
MAAAKPPRIVALTWDAAGALVVLTGRGKDTTCLVVREGKTTDALPAVRDAAFVLALPGNRVLTLSPKGKALLAGPRQHRESATGFAVESAVLCGATAWTGGVGCSLARLDEGSGEWVRDEGLRRALAKDLDDEEENSVFLLLEGPRGLIAAVDSGDDGAHLCEHNGERWVRRGRAETIALAHDPEDGTLIASGSDRVIRVGTSEVVAELEYASGLAWLDGALFVATGGRVARLEHGVPAIVITPVPGTEPRQPFAAGKRLAFACGSNAFVISNRGERVACWLGEDPHDVAALTARANQLAEKALKGKSPTRFKLTNKKLRRFPEPLLELEGLTALELSMNELEALPEAFGRLRQLETLDLRHNHLTALPDSIGQLTKLRSLDLHLNTISTLPGSFSALKDLERLDLGMNTSLQTLDVRGARPLREVPPSLRGLEKLKRLVLAMNELSSLPPWFAELTALEDLDLSSNRFEVFPDVLLALPNLRRLSIGYQPWTSGVTPLHRKDDKHHAPRGLEKVCRLTGLVELAIDRLALTALPDKLAALEQLEVLHAGFNDFTSLPPGLLELPKLKTLTLDYVPLDAATKKAIARRFPPS